MKDVESATGAESCDERRELEKAAVRLFLPRYEKVTGKKWHAEMGDRPDAVLRADDGMVLGLEVAHLYGDGEEARFVLNRSPKRIFGLQEFGAVLERLEKLIKKKAEVASRYDCTFPLVLLVRSASPLWEPDDFRRAARFPPPVPAPFQEAWLLARKGWEAGWQLLRLGAGP